MRGLAAVLAGMLAAVALPAGAQAPVPAVDSATDPALVAAIGVCLAEGLPLAERAAAVEAAGWVALAPAERGAAVQALAPLQVISVARLFLPDGPAPEPEAAAEDWRAAAGQLELAAAWDSPRNLWFTMPATGAQLRLYDPLGAPPSVRCEMAAPVEAATLEAVLGQPGERHDFGRLAVVVHPQDRGALELYTLVDGVFGEGVTVLPQLATPLRNAP